MPTLGKVASLVPKLPGAKDKAKLTTEDGKEYEIPILESKYIGILQYSGSMGEKFLDIRSLYPQTDMFLYDPGYTITGSCASSITFSDEKGKLLYRGYRIEDLAEKSTFTEVCFLLLYGELPTQTELQNFEDKM